MSPTRADLAGMHKPRHTVWPLLRRVVAVMCCCAMALSGGCIFKGKLKGKSPGEVGSESLLDIFAPTSPAEAARWAVDPYNADKRQRGVRLLSNAPFGGEPVYIELYLRSIEDEDAAVRAAAMHALAMHGDASRAALITEHVSDASRLVRRESVRALQRLHNPVAIDPLIGALDERRDDDVDTRMYAATALGQYAEPRVVQALIGALSDRRLGVNQAALESLRILTGQDFGYIVRRWVAWTVKTDDLFAGRGTYMYPVFHRDPTIFERVVPFWEPPNEISGRPAGMPVAGKPDQSGGEAAGDSGSDDEKDAEESPKESGG